MFQKGSRILKRNLPESRESHESQLKTGRGDSFEGYKTGRKQILPMQGERTSLVIDNDYLAHLRGKDERIDICLGNEKFPFNCVKFSDCEVTSECVRSMAIFARTVIIEDSSFDCEDIFFNLKNELEFRGGKIRVSTMRVVGKYVNFEQGSLIDGNQLIIAARKSASLSGEYSMETQIVCQAPEISIANGCTCATKDLLLFPTKFLEIIKGARLRSKNLFIGGIDEKTREAVTGTAKVDVSGEVEVEEGKVSILTALEIVLSGSFTANEMDCLSGKLVKVEECRLKARKLQVHALEVCVDGASVLEGSEFSFMVQEKVVLADLSSFQFDKMLVMECRSLVSGSRETKLTAPTKKHYRNGEIFITTTESIEIGGTLICKKLLLNCQTRSGSNDAIVRENAKFDVETLIVIVRSVPANEGTSSEGDNVVFESGSEILYSKLLAIESEINVVMKGSLKRSALWCNSPNVNVVIKTPKSIKFVNCSVEVGDSQLQFGREIVLCDGARVYVSGKLFLARHLLNGIDRGILRVEKNCLLVARKDIVCQLGQCYIEGTLASEEESILLGQNINQNQMEKDEAGGKNKVVKLDQKVIKKFIKSLKPSQNPLLSLLNKVQEERIKLVNNIRRIIHMKEEEEEEVGQKSFVMEYIFISGEIRAKKTVMLVSRDITIQNRSSIMCTAEWDSTAILIYSNRSVFQCSSELGASNVLIVSPIVFQLLSLVKAHNLSISAAVLFRLACLCNSTKTMLKVPLILSALNVVAPNVNKTLRKMRCDLVENCVEVVLLIERLAEARVEHREFEAFLVESLRMFKKHSNLAVLHSLELVHFVFQVVNLLVPKTALIITVNVMSIIRATMFFLFSVKNVRKSIKRYLTRERQNFILIEIVGEGMFSLYQVVGVVTSFTSLYNQIKSLRSIGMDFSRTDVPSLRGLSQSILDRTKELVSRGPLSALSNILGVFDTFVLNDYTKYAVGLFSYLPSSMRFSILNLSGELQLGMYVVNNSSTFSLNGSVVVMSYNCSSTDLASFNPRSNVVICNGSITENSAIGKLDRGVKVGQRSLVLAGGRRVHDGGFHFGERVVLQTRSLEQRNNKFFYSHIGGFSVNDWKLLRLSEFRPVVSDSRASSTRTSTTRGDDTNAFEVYDSGVIAKGVDKSVLRSGNNSIDSVLVEDGSVFFLKDTALKVNEISGEVTLKNVQVKVSCPHNLSMLHVAGGNNSLVSSLVSDTDFNVVFPVHLADGAYVNIISPSTIFDGETYGNGHVAFYNAEIGENASIHHTGSSLIELKNEQELCDAIAGKGKFSNISNNGLVNFKVNGLMRISEGDEKFFYESSIRDNQDLGIIADSIEVGLEVEREKGIQLLSVKEDVVIRKSITSRDGSVIIDAKHGNVLIEDNVEKGTITTKCRLETKPLNGPDRSRLQKENIDASSRTPFHKLIVVDGIEVVKSVEKIELCAKDSVIITANEGRIILDPCVIHGDESVVLQGNEGVSMKDVCVTSVTSKSSRNPFYSKRKKVIKGVSETTKITSNGDISIIAVEGTISTSGICLTSNGGHIIQRGRDGVYNESVVAKTSISEKVHVMGGLSKKHRKEKHDVETPCVFQSTEGIYVESERGSIVNVGMLATGNGVCSFKAGENVLLERRTLNHEILLKKQGFDLSLSILGVNIFESSSTFFENLKMEFLENHLPPIGNSPIEVARSIEEGNVPEIAANLANALLIPGNLRFILDSPVKFGLKFNDYDVHNHHYDTPGEGKIEMDFLYINACDTVEFGNAFGFNVGSVEIDADKLIENGAFLNYEIENISSGVGFGFEPFGGDLLHCVPSMSVDLSIVKESCSIAVCQIGNTASLKVNVSEWDKNGSQTFAETVEGRVGTVSFNSTSSLAEGKRHGISLGTTSLGLSDGHSRSSLISDQTGLFAVNVDDFHVESVILRGSRCPVRGTDITKAEEVREFEKVSGTSLGVDFASVISLSAIALVGGGGGNVSKLKGVGIERKDYVAIVQNSFENVDESEFFFRANDSFNEDEASAVNNLELVRQSYGSLTRHDNSFVEDVESNVTENGMSTLLSPGKKVLKDKSFNLKFHYHLSYRLLRDGLEKMHKEVVDEGLLPCLEGAAFDDVDPLLLFPVLDIFYDSSTSELDKYTQILFFGDGCEKAKYCDLTEDEKQEVFIFQSYLQDGGDFRDFMSLCNFYEERKQELSDEYAKKSMKKYVQETYPELYFSYGLHNLQNVEEVRRVFMDIKLTYEPDDPMVRQMTFEMDQYYAEQLYNASWAELSSAQQNEIGRIREHALMYQVTNQEVDFAEYLQAKEAQFAEYFANHHQEPDTNVLTSFGVLPIELLKEPDPIHSECMPYMAPQLDNERKYAVPGSGLFFLVAPPEKNGWEGMCEYASSWKSCIIDYFSYHLAGNPDIDYQPSQKELHIDASLRSIFSSMLDFVPFVNGVKWGFQGISGYNPITNARLDWKERMFDLTFSMFYFPPVGNVIIGYGKGAVWEPMKGAWNVGKILVKRERSFKGVAETIRATGSAIVNSIALPTQHLGAFLEMKMLWGLNRGGVAFRSARAWWSKMGSWKANFWNKWKWSKRRHWNIMTTRFAANEMNFAFAGGVPTVTGNGANFKASPARSTPFAMAESSQGSSGGKAEKVLALTDGEIVYEDLDVLASKYPSHVFIDRIKKHGLAYMEGGPKTDLIVTLKSHLIQTKYLKLPSFASEGFKSKVQIDENGRFRHPPEFGDVNISFYKYWVFRDMVKDWYSRGSVKIPKPGEMEIATPQFLGVDRVIENYPQVACTWIGHNSCYMQINDGETVVNFLTDPMFSKRASMFSWIGPKRYAPTPCAIKDLPGVDFVVISHDHYDHLDVESVRQLIESFAPTFYVPLGLKPFFQKKFPRAHPKVIEMDWWGEVKHGEGVKIMAFPSQHFTGRWLTDGMKTLWCSWGVEVDLKNGEKFKTFFAGDTGYNEVCFKQIGEHFGPVDLGLIPIGAYAPPSVMGSVHVLPADSLKIAKDVGCRQNLGIHWKTFVLTTEHVMDPVKDLRKALGKLSEEVDDEWFLTLLHGETKYIDFQEFVGSTKPPPETKVKGGSGKDPDSDLFADAPDGVIKGKYDVQKEHMKYWQKRYTLFERFDSGVWVDQEGLFTVAPEKIALQTAERIVNNFPQNVTIVEGMFGCGGNLVAFAQNPNVKKIYAVDINPEKVEMAQHNCEVYNCDMDKIEFITADIFELMRKDYFKGIKINVCFLSPPWGGPKYIEHDQISLRDITFPTGEDGLKLLRTVQDRISSNVAICLPRNLDVGELRSFITPQDLFELEPNYVGARQKSLTIYFDQLVVKPSPYDPHLTQAESDKRYMDGVISSSSKQSISLVESLCSERLQPQPLHMETIEVMRSLFRTYGDPERARNYERYLKNVVLSHGMVTSELMKRVFTPVYELIASSPLSKRIDIGFEVLKSVYGDEKKIGVEILAKNVKDIMGRDRDSLFVKSFVRRIGFCVENNVYDWATADILASRVVCECIKLDTRGIVIPVVMSWKNALKCDASDNNWLQRIACVSFVKIARFGKHNDTIMTIVDSALDNSYRFTQLGAGWVLRELSLADNALVIDYIRANYARFSREGLRYAIEKMDPDLRRTILHQTRNHLIEEVPKVVLPKMDVAHQQSQFVFKPVCSIDKMDAPQPVVMSNGEFVSNYKQGCYTTVRSFVTEGGVIRVVMFEKHVQRLVNSFNSIHNEEVIRADKFREELMGYLAKCKEQLLDLQVAKISITVTRYGGINYCPHIHLEKLESTKWKDINVDIVRGSRTVYNEVKDLKWVEIRNDLYKHKQGMSEEVLLLEDDGLILEGCSSNFFVVTQDNLVLTTNYGIVFGSIRDLVLEACKKNGLEVVLVPPSIHLIDDWKEAFITSTTRLVASVKCLYKDGKLIKEMSGSGVGEKVRKTVIESMKIRAFSIGNKHKKISK